MGVAASAQLQDRSRSWKHSNPADGVPKGDHLLDEGIAVSMARAIRPAEAILAHAQARCKYTAMARYNAFC
jgi:hypothetical protein